MTTQRTTAIRLRPRSTLAIVLCSLTGLMAFGWPLLVGPDSGLAHQGDAPLVLAFLLPLLLAVVLAEISEGGLDIKAIALLGVLSAVGAALRPLGPARPGWRPCSSCSSSAGVSSAPASGSCSGQRRCSPPRS